MPSIETSISNSRKRKFPAGAKSTTKLLPPATTKRRKVESQQRQRTPSSFWDNLSRQWLSPRALREFDRRTVWPTAPIPPHRTGREEKIHQAHLKRFARHGGPSLDDLRAYPELSTTSPFIHKTRSQNGAKSRTTMNKYSKARRSSAYDGGFEQHLIDHCIYPEGHGGVDDMREPNNWEDINTRLTASRASLSPSRFTREDFAKFRDKNRAALSENTVMSKSFPIITGDANIPSQENIPFGNFEDLTDGSIVKAIPDFYDGSTPASLHKRVREELDHYIVPSTNISAPCLPNFFTEGKGPTGSVPVARRQALYDGALAARGVHKLRSYIDPETAFDNNAYTITATYYGGDGTLTLYAHHPTPSAEPNNPIEFHMTQLRSFSMTDIPDTFRQGASALRNARDWAREERDRLITSANNIVHSAMSATSMSPASIRSPSMIRVSQVDSERSTDGVAIIRPTDGPSIKDSATRRSSTRLFSRRSTKKAVRAKRTVRNTSRR